MRVVFLGMKGDLPASSLRAILRSSAQVVGVVCCEPEAAGGRPGAAVRARRWASAAARAILRRESDPARMARSQGIEWIRVREANTPELVEWLRQRSPDLMCITTFPFLLGAEMLSVPRVGTINLHRSLLPRHRGPAPLFWLARAGDATGGATIHWVDVGEDTGEIILQQEFPIPDGMTSEELDQRAGAVGVRLMQQAVERIASAGSSVATRPQGPGDRHSRPRARDGEIDAAWGARRTRNFVRMARKWLPLYLFHDGMRHYVDDASWLPDQQSRDRRVAVRGRVATITWADGTVVLRQRGRLERAWVAARALLAGSWVGAGGGRDAGEH